MSEAPPGPPPTRAGVPWSPKPCWAASTGRTGSYGTPERCQHQAPTVSPWVAPCRRRSRVSPGPPWSHRPDRTPGGAGGEGGSGAPRSPGLYGAERRNGEWGTGRTGLWFGGVHAGGGVVKVGGTRRQLLGVGRWGENPAGCWGRWERGCPGFLMPGSPRAGDPWCYWTHWPRWPPRASREYPPHATGPVSSSSCSPSLLPPPVSFSVLVGGLLSPHPSVPARALRGLVMLCRVQLVPKVPREPW